MTEKKRPNIVWFITDDTGDCMLGYAGGNVLTPNIDRIAHEGVVATQYHCSAPACTPSRWSYIRGQYPGRCVSSRFMDEKEEGRPYNLGFNVDILPGQPNIAAVFRDAGYATGFTGKWHTGTPRGKFNGHKFHPDDDPTNPEVARKLREDYTAMQEQIRGVGFDYAEAVAWGNTDNRPLKRLQYHNLEWHTEAALNFIEQSAQGDKPFFLNMATTTMHGPHHVRSLETDGRETEVGLLDKMPDVQPPRQSVLDRLEKADLPVDHLTAGSLWMDDAFGAVMQRVEDLGLADNTIFIWSTDHGMGTRSSKFTCYQGGVRIPYCMKWDGHITPGFTTDALMQNVDFLPTLCAAAGIDIPEGVDPDGLNRWPQLTGKAGNDREDLYFEWGYTRAVRTQKYKYIAFRHTPEQIADMKAKPDGYAMSMSGKYNPDYPMHMHPHYFDPDQLYDLENDPDEKINLADKPEYADTLAEMKKRLKAFLDTFGDPFDLDTVDAFIKSEAYQQLVAKTMKNDSLWNSYFYIENAY